MIDKTLEAWRWGNPAEVAERAELQANAAAARESAKVIERVSRQTERERIRAKVFRKARAA